MLHFRFELAQRKDGGWTHGWFLYHLDQKITLIFTEKDSICRVLGYKEGWILRTEYILYRQWQKDQIIGQILEYHNTPSFDKNFPLSASTLDLSVENHLNELSFALKS